MLRLFPLIVFSFSSHTYIVGDCSALLFSFPSFFWFFLLFLFPEISSGGVSPFLYHVPPIWQTVRHRTKLLISINFLLNMHATVMVENQTKLNCLVERSVFSATDGMAKCIVFSNSISLQMVFPKTEDLRGKVALLARLQQKSYYMERLQCSVLRVRHLFKLKFSVSNCHRDFEQSSLGNTNPFPFGSNLVLKD